MHWRKGLHTCYKKLLNFEPHELQRLFHESKTHQLHTGGYMGGRSFATAAIAKAFPKLKVIVPNLKSMDNMISLGVQPSQLIMPSEFRNTSRFDAMSIYRETINNGGNQ